MPSGARIWCNRHRDELTRLCGRLLVRVRLTFNFWLQILSYLSDNFSVSQKFSVLARIWHHDIFLSPKFFKNLSILQFLMERQLSSYMGHSHLESNMWHIFLNLTSIFSITGKMVTKNTKYRGFFRLCQKVLLFQKFTSMGKN